MPNCGSLPLSIQKKHCLETIKLGILTPLRIEFASMLKKISLILILFYSHLAFSGAANKPSNFKPTQSFADFVFSKQGSGTWPALTPRSSHQNPIEDTLLKSNDGVKLINFYEKILSNQTPQNSPKWHAKWEVQLLDADLALPTLHPTNEFSNRTLIWAIDANGQRRYAFRPIDTSTGCDSSCTPVVFHLQIEVNGQTMAIHEEKNRPLRKAYHQTFSLEDKNKILEISKKLPKELFSFGSPSSVADWQNHYPPQTWTFLSQFSVKEAAFTSYRIFEAIYTSTRAIQETPDSHSDLQYQFENLYGEYLRLTNFNEILSQIKSAHTTLESNKTHSKILEIHTYFLPLLHLWLIESGHPDLKKIKKTFSLPIFSNFQLTAFCRFQENLVDSENGRVFWLAMNKSWKLRPNCGEKVERFLTLYSKIKTQSTQLHLTDLDALNISHLPLFVQNNPKILLDILDSLPEKTLPRLKIISILNEHYPKIFTQTKTKFLIEELKVLSKELKDEIRRDHLMLIQRQFIPESIYLPNFNISSATGSIAFSKIQKKDPSFLIVFFAPWCPHCQELAKKIFAAKLSPATLSRIHFIEIFSRSEKDLNDFCLKAAISAENCKKIRSIKPTESTFKKLVSSIGLNGIPRILLIDKEQRVLASNINLDFHPLSDPKHQIEMIFNAVDKLKEASL
jgi:thiol-disulfide isomerase/thioredoxin